VPPLTPAVLSSVVAWYRGWLAHRSAVLRVPGVQVAVRVDGELVLSAAYGCADLAEPTPLTARHLFRIASHSKTFTAVAVLQLMESGVLRLDDTVGRWLPQLAETAPDVARRTLRQLLSHGGGMIRDGHDCDHWVLGLPFPDRQRLLAIADDDAAVFPADRDFKYSNIGYGLLGLVIEAASGRPYNTYVGERIVEPLGLADTGPEYDPARAPDYATGYTALALGERVPVDHVDTLDLAAATGFYATAEDLTAYFTAHLPGDERLLSDDAKRSMRRQEWAVDDGGYGLGLILNTVRGRKLFGHSGGYPGHITRSLVDPEDRVVVSVLTNGADGPAAEFADAFFSVLALATDPALDTPPVPDGIAPARFTGQFATLMGVSEVALLGDRLWALNPDQADPAVKATPLAVEDATTLRITERSGYGSPGEAMHYTFAADGTVESLRDAGTTSVPLHRWREQIATVDRIRLRD